HESTALPVPQKTAAPVSRSQGLTVTQQTMLHIALIVMALLMFFPFLWMIATALRPPGQEADISLIPRPYLAFETFSRAWNYPRAPFPLYTLNSFVIAIVSTVIGVALNSLAGFAFAKYR